MGKVWGMAFSWEAEAADLSPILWNRLTQRDLLQFALLACLQNPWVRCLVSRKAFVWDVCRSTRSTFEGDRGLSSFLISFLFLALGCVALFHYSSCPIVMSCPTKAPKQQEQLIGSKSLSNGEPAQTLSLYKWTVSCICSGVEGKLVIV